jgi:glycosyltransferase involved in cell wall biosynthesis
VTTPSYSATDVRSFFDRCASTGFPEEHGHPQRLLEYRVALVRNLTRLRPTDVVLDLGCGNGHHLLALGPDVGRGIGIDISPGMIELARARLRNSPWSAKLTFEVDDAGELRGIPDRSVDLVVCVGAFEHMLDKRAVLASIYRVLRFGGRFVCLAPLADYVWYRTIAPLLGFATKHLSSDRLLTCDEFSALLEKAGFRGIRSAPWTFIPKGDAQLRRIAANCTRCHRATHAIGVSSRRPLTMRLEGSPLRHESSPVTHSIRLATRAKCRGRSPPSLDVACAPSSGQVGRVAFAVPGDLATPTGGYRYDRRIIEELRQLGWKVDVLDLGDGFPFPSVAQRATALARLSAVPGGCPIVLDGLAFGALPEAGALRSRTPLIALVHQPLALESGLDATQADVFRQSERAALAAAARVVVTSESTGRIVVSDYSVQSQRISVVRPGNDRVPPVRGSNDSVVRLLSIGSVVPDKGYDLLIAAVATIDDLPWRLTIAGDRTRNLAAAARLDADISAHGLGDRVTVLGAVAPERVIELYLASDLFVLASRFEGYGMALAEAIAHGLPVVSTTAGAIPDTVPEGAGLLVPPCDVAALAQALRRLIGDRAERQRLATHARAAGTQLPTWQDSARLFAGTIATVG